MARIALLAGGGALPNLVASGAKKEGYSVFVVAIKGFTDPLFAAEYPHVWLHLGQVGKLISEIKKNRIEALVFAGHVKRPSLNNVLKLRVDKEGMKLLWRLRKRGGDDTILRRAAGFFEEYGLKIMGADQLVPDSLMPKGILSEKKPTDDETRDILFAARILRGWAEMDQGQSIVVQHGLILGVEAIEGTDELIRRCSTYKRDGSGPILIKMKKPQQDRRLDLPTIGEFTVKQAIAAGFSGIAVQANDALFLQPNISVEEADKHDLFVVGFDPLHG